MQNLFLIDGASGVGKSDLLRWAVDNNAHNVAFLPKATTRKEREYEKNDREILLDLEFLTEDAFVSRQFDYSYVYGGERYGFSSEELFKYIQKYDNVLAIVRSTQLIQRIANDFKFINVVPMYIYTDSAQLTGRLRQKGFSEDEIAFRVSRSEIALRDYFTHPDFYREIIINISSRDVFHSTIERIMDKHHNAPHVDPNLISVMMSYNPKNKKLDDYFDAMKDAVRQTSTKLKCIRLDSVPGIQKISTEFNSIASRARCFIVDITESKPNVYYELGYLHGVSKTCIITAEEGTKPTLYPAEYKILFYQSARDLRQKLHKELQQLLAIGKANSILYAESA